MRIEVSCNEHGPMKRDKEHRWWVCTGYSGEGCLTGMIVTDQQVASGAELPGVTFERSAG